METPKNKKVINATSSSADNIIFKSKLEKMVYRTLCSYGIKPEYEKYTFTVWDGFTPVIPFYDQETDAQRLKRQEILNLKSKPSKILILKTGKIVGIRYTPDFYFKYKDIDVWIEVKGIENDVFYIKKKLFRKYLQDKFESTGQKSLFFEIYTKKQVLQSLQIIKEYATNESTNKDKGVSKMSS